MFTVMLLEGTDLRAKTASLLAADSGLASSASQTVFDTMVDEIVRGLCFDIHRTIKTGAFTAVQLTQEDRPPHPIAGHVDVFGTTPFTSHFDLSFLGTAVTTITGLPSLRAVPQIECPNCDRSLAASRFAPHLEKCMGMGRNSSRVASRRIADKKESYREGGQEEQEDEDDDDWVEPGKKEIRRRRDKNSPRRNKFGKYKGEEGAASLPVAQSYEQLSLEDRRQLLTSVCGVPGQGKLCARSVRCAAHTDHQRR